MTRSECLKAAESAVNGERDEKYGKPESNFGTIAILWTTYFDRVSKGRPYKIFESCDVAAMLALVKIARLSQTPDHADSWVDLAGYAACGAEVSDDK